MADLAEEERLGIVARSVLENEAFAGALVDIEKRLMADWRGSAPEDTAGRERIHQKLTAMNEMVHQLTTYLQTGVMAEREIQDQSEKRAAKLRQEEAKAETRQRGVDALAEIERAIEDERSR